MQAWRRLTLVVHLVDRFNLHDELLARVLIVGVNHRLELIIERLSEPVLRHVPDRQPGLPAPGKENQQHKHDGLKSTGEMFRNHGSHFLLEAGAVALTVAGSSYCLYFQRIAEDPVSLNFNTCPHFITKSYHFVTPNTNNRFYGLRLRTGITRAYGDKKGAGGRVIQ